MLNTFRAYDWPGSVRQMRNVIESMLIIGGDPNNNVLGLEHIPSDLLSSDVTVVPDLPSDIYALPLREAREVFEARYLSEQLERFDGNISKVAKTIGMERSALHRKLKSLNIQ